MIHIGHVSEIVRYPVKSMAGRATESAFLGWHGLAGDRRFAFRRLDARVDFPLDVGVTPELGVRNGGAGRWRLGLREGGGGDEQRRQGSDLHCVSPEG